MPTLKGMLQEAHRGDALVVTGPHSRWLELNEEDQVYTEEAIAFEADVHRKKFKHERSGRFSPSAMGECHRRVVLGFAGAPQQPPDLDNQEMMDHGRWGHLKWQLEGLSQGWLKDAETWAENTYMRCGGSRDGTLEDGSNFELKTVHWSIYSRVVGVAQWPKSEALLQDATYKWLADIENSSIVYEDRSSGQFHEFRIPRSKALEDNVISRLKYYNERVEDDLLPPVLDQCSMRTGTVYKRCPYRKICLKAKSVTEFGQIS